MGAGHKSESSGRVGGAGSPVETGLLSVVAEPERQSSAVDLPERGGMDCSDGQPGLRESGLRHLGALGLICMTGESSKSNTQAPCYKGASQAVSGLLHAGQQRHFDKA
jgi:hypothetical protein